MADVSAHGFWKQGITAMSDIRIINLDMGSYLCMTLEKAIAKGEKENNDLYLQSYLVSSSNFTPMLYSADRITVVEAMAAQKILIALLSYKLKREY